MHRIVKNHKKEGAGKLAQSVSACYGRLSNPMTLQKVACFYIIFRQKFFPALSFGKKQSNMQKRFDFVSERLYTLTVTFLEALWSSG